MHRTQIQIQWFEINFCRPQWSQQAPLDAEFVRENVTSSSREPAWGITNWPSQPKNHHKNTRKLALAKKRTYQWLSCPFLVSKKKVSISKKWCNDSQSNLMSINQNISNPDVTFTRSTHLHCHPPCLVWQSSLGAEHKPFRKGWAKHQCTHTWDFCKDNHPWIKSRYIKGCIPVPTQNMS